MEESDHAIKNILAVLALLGIAYAMKGILTAALPGMLVLNHEGSRTSALRP